jgi:PTH1 family peptidyl-tRNA hydrolase
VFLVVGIGNIGPDYVKTRHNVGFVLADKFCNYLNLSFSYRANIFSSCAIGKKVILIKPATWVNLSGKAVEQAVSVFSPEEIIVIHDDMDIPLGNLKIKKGGGDGGHKGVRSVIQHIGEDFIRIRIGIGKPNGDIVKYVLGEFTKEEKIVIEQVIETAIHAILDIVENGLSYAMNKYNSHIEVKEDERV